MAVQVELFECLDEVERDAAGALDRQRQRNVYDSIEWLKLTRAHVLSQVPLVAARARDASGRTAWLFLQDHGNGRAAAFASWYTLAFAPIFAGLAVPTSDERPDLRAPLAAALARKLRARFDVISLAPMADEDRDVALLKHAFASAGWLALRAATTANWIAKTHEQPFARYWEDRPSRLRNTVERKRRRTQLEIAIYDHFDPAAWADYESVYRSSWKPAEGSPEFLRAFAERSGRWGSLRLGIARDAGRPVAAQLWTVDQSVATIHKLAHDEAAKAESPGTLLSAAMFEHVIERDRPAIIDFGTGDDAYKADWMDLKRPLYRLDLYNLRSPRGITAAGHAAARALVRRLRNN